MSRFNQPVKPPQPNTLNLAGGAAFSQSPELELVSIMLTSLVNDQFYQKATDTMSRLKGLIGQCDKLFVAKAAIYARKTFGMRSITHVAAAELARYAGGQPWGRKFYEAVIERPDDMTEIASYYLANCADAAPANKRKKKTLTSAMKAGFAKAFDRFDAYTLAKYRGEGKELKLVDVVNMVRPVPTTGNAGALENLAKGTLKSTETWESQLTQAGQKATSDDEKDEFKKEVWANLIRQNKLPIFALLRNLRNIMEQSPEVLYLVIEKLTNKTVIGKSKIFPFRFVTAYDEIQKVANGSLARTMLIALNKAIDISTKNVPSFEGDTLVVLDVSSSMTSLPYGSKSKTTPAKIGSLFAAVLAKVNNADLMTFDHSARYVRYNPADSTVTIANVNFNGGSTNFSSIFQTANRPYARIFILSDMQGWEANSDLRVGLQAYKRTTGANPFLYSFDLQGYGTMMFPESKVFAIAGFSEKIFDIIKMLETDKNAMINEINKVEF